MTTSFMEDVIFPVHISKGSMGGPDWLVDIVTLVSGREERNTPWSAPLRTYDAKWSVRSKAEIYEILEAYLVAKGPLRGFRLLDWTDYRSCAPQLAPANGDQVLGTGDGITTSFELWKAYTRGAHSVSRRINKPFGKIFVAAAGVDLTSGFAVDMANGLITFDTAPGAGVNLTWGGQFHVPVRFAGRLDQTTLFGEINEIPSIPLQELRL